MKCGKLQLNWSRCRILNFSNILSPVPLPVWAKCGAMWGVARAKQGDKPEDAREVEAEEKEEEEEWERRREGKRQQLTKIFVESDCLKSRAATNIYVPRNMCVCVCVCESSVCVCVTL